MLIYELLNIFVDYNIPLNILLVSVVIDYAEDENILNTGDFELVHKHKIN